MRTTVLARACAWWMVVLILLPFTAPCTTFDLSNAGALGGRQDGPARAHSQAGAPVDLSLPQVLSRSTTATSLRLLALTASSSPSPHADRRSVSRASIASHHPGPLGPTLSTTVLRL